MEAQHTALDGSAVTVRARGLDLAKRGSSVVRAGSPRYGRTELTAFRRQDGEEYARAMRVTLTEAFAYRNGTLRVGEEFRNGGKTLLAVWEGSRSALAFALHNNVSAADAMAFLEDFTLSECQTGEVTCLPRDSNRVSFEDSPDVLKLVPDFGLLHMAQLTPSRGKSLPRWPGSIVAGGELFVEDPGEERMHFVLVGRSAITVLMPAHDALGDRMIDELGHLEVDWSPA